jgi:hypothetical protein
MPIKPWLSVPRSFLSGFLLAAFMLTASSAQVQFQGDFLSPIYLGGTAGSANVVTADFNGDGKLDAAVASASFNSFSVMLGNGDGSFQPEVDYVLTGKINSPVWMSTADVNNDGKVDIIVASINALNVSGGGGVSVFLGNGDGTFQSQVDYVLPTHPAGVIAADFNEDGKVDLAITNNDTASISILLNQGNGTFGAPVNYAVGNGPFAVVAADFNGDGKLDLAVSNYCVHTYVSPSVDGFLCINPPFDNTVSILLGNGDGTFQTAKNNAAGNGPYQLVAADLNNDGKTDLVIADNVYENASVISAATVLLGNGDGTFQASAISLENPMTTGFSVVAADFNGDSRLDIGVVTNGGSLAELLGNGDGTFQPPVFYFHGYALASVVTGDFNRDGHTDLGASAGRFLVILNAAGTSRKLSSLSVQVTYKGSGMADVAYTVTSPSTIPTGTLTVLVDNKVLTDLPLDSSGTAPFLTSGLSLGSHTLGAIYSGDTFNAASTSSAQISVQPAPSMTSLTSSQNPSTVGQSVIFQAIVTSTSADLATVTFFDGTTSLGTSAFPSPGTGGIGANFCVSSLGAGNHSITASYSGGTYTIPSISPPLVQVVNGGGLGLSLFGCTPSSATVQAGSTATYSLSVGGSGMSGSASLSCTGAPTGATCSIPTSVSLNSTTASNFTVTVITSSRSRAGLLWWFSTYGIFALGLQPRRLPRRRTALILLFTLLLAICSCGGGTSQPSSNPTGTPPGTYMLTVTAISGSVTQSLPLTLVVQ